MERLDERGQVRCMSGGQQTVHQPRPMSHGFRTSEPAELGDCNQKTRVLRVSVCWAPFSTVRSERCDPSRFFHIINYHEK